MIEYLPDLNFVRAGLPDPGSARAGMNSRTIIRSNGEAGRDNLLFSIFRTPFSFPIS